MDRNQILSEATQFAGFTIVRKLSKNHNGEREVYLVKDGSYRDTVLTVFDIASDRYSSKETNGCEVQDFVEEVRFFVENENLDGVPKMLDCGIDVYEGHYLGWMAQEYVDGESLHSLIMDRGKLDLGDALTIAKQIGEVIKRASRFANGGGHYGVSTDNIIVRYDGNEIVDVKLVGFSNIGASYLGKAPIDLKCLDKRFRAPEASKGIFNKKSDIHSLGMVMLAMLAGYPRAIQTGRYTIDFGGEEINMDEVSTMEYYSAQWNKADECISQALRLILRRATAISPSSRFNDMDNFFEYLSRFERVYEKHYSLKKNEHVCNASTTEEGTRHEESGCRAEEEGHIKTKKKEEKLPKSKAMSKKVSNPEKDKGLDSVAGMADLKALFRLDFIRIVKNPNVARAYGIKPSNCTLLYGPQGCGKTFIAEKAAQESGLKYRIVRPSDLGSIYIHGAQQKIAETFAEAEKKGPMILIFDEFDALVPQRSAEMNENQANEVNEMLTQLNNCAERGIFCLCTTNRPDRIDPAVMRKGRVDRSIYVSLPDLEARKELFKLALEWRPMDNTVDYCQLADATDKYTCSDITYIVEEAARGCFEETLDKTLSDPLPISQERLLEVIKNTSPSVSEWQNKEYLDLRAKMENRESGDGRKKVGFAVG